MYPKTAQTQVASAQGGSTAQESVRLHYLDWLRVLATLGVFLFHASCVFGPFEFESHCPAYQNAPASARAA